MQKHWVVGLILVGLAVGTLGGRAQTKELAPLGQPGSYFRSEVSAGTVGALAGGLASAIAGLVIVDYLYGPLCEGGLGFFGLTCRLPILEIAGVAFLIGDVVGGVIGVAIAGSYTHVQGNIRLSFTGALGGAAVALSLLGATVFFSGGTIAMVHVLIFPFLVSYFTAVGATLGYHIDASVEPIVLSPTGQGLILVGFRTSW
jgi:hypothetical protein